MLELIPNLKIFGEGLNNKKHVHILWMLITLVNKSFAYGRKGPKWPYFKETKSTNLDHRL
jgi:hypothetical protein